MIGIKETKDLALFASTVVTALEDAKKDDGTISTAEIAAILVKTTPAGVFAIAGCKDISQELADLTEEERQELIDYCIPILTRLVGLFIDLES